MTWSIERARPSIPFKPLEPPYVTWKIQAADLRVGHQVVHGDRVAYRVDAVDLITHPGQVQLAVVDHGGIHTPRMNPRQELTIAAPMTADRPTGAGITPPPVGRPPKSSRRAEV